MTPNFQPISAPIDLFPDVMMQVGKGVDTKTGDLINLINQGWRATYAELFGQSFVESLDSAETDDKHHSEAIEWHWEARLALLKGGLPPNNEYAYFPIWARGNMKSSIAEAMVVIDAVLSVAYKQKGYCLYIGREKDRVKENVGNLEALLSRKKIKEYAPELSEVAKNDETNSKRQWTGTFLHTKAGYIIKGGTVESSQAGSRIKHLGDDTERDTRVTFFVPDDIDSREDSPVIAETRFRLLTSEILPMKQENTLTFFAQNLISRYSVMYRIQKGGAKVLTNRRPTQPIPAVRDLETETRTVNGIPKDVVLSGRPTWRVWNLVRVQNEIDTMGLPAFLREMQHEVDQSKEGLILYNYDDAVHVISESEFASVYGSLNIWLKWRKKPGNDWARTKSAKHANVAGWFAVSSQNTPLPNFKFIFHPSSFPANSAPEDVAERLLSKLSPYAYGSTTWAQLRNQTLIRANSEFYAETVLERIEYERGQLASVVQKYAATLLEKSNVQAGEMSHERDDVRQIYAQVYGLAMKATNPGKYGGIDKANRDLTIDWTLPHAFRPDTKGYSRTAIVVPDDKTKPFKIINNTKVYPPKPYPEAIDPTDLHNDNLIRHQFSNWRYQDTKLTEGGERIDEPLKMDDDFGNLYQMWQVGAPLTNIALNDNELIEEVIRTVSPSLTVESMRARSPYTKGFSPGQEAARREAEQRARRELDLPKDDFEVGGDFGDFGFEGF